MRDRVDTQELLAVGDACLSWLAADVNELERFMALAGYSPQRLRESVGTRALAEGLVDYFGRHEALLLAMCANAGLDVNRVMRLWHGLNPQS
ncbi:DUF3572 family protein [Pelagibacterium halotolerans]|uniref:DUF3572 domain-containing protein n=1 Tax=Pelagibacterium halotolerans (strain DSM 22347 / JCM 15775 / CGMCC 1.7692 / B2) TaxID=1082931 RepID=G4RBD1_PELHB|nr:DUF3572 family protein [Pelagibacterium halotolerans]AEQ51629.1 hypothetical protein KKY_1612 [Pelagibacterium halotolerans B2]QJR18542.1 DUF3572 family protein [Pelagibacterium halotolerans]